MSESRERNTETAVATVRRNPTEAPGGDRFVGTGVPFLVQALSLPESPVSFLSDAFVLILALTVIAGALTGLRGARPDQRRRIVEGTDIQIELPGATAARAPIAPAVYRYICDVPGHEAMVGELVVR